MENMVFNQGPERVGWWVLPGGTPNWKTKFAAYKKPNWLCRFSMKHVFGWVWEDEILDH